MVRGSAVRSGMTSSAPASIVWAQTEQLIGSSCLPSPTSDLNHCRSASTKLTRATGARQT